MGQVTIYLDDEIERKMNEAVKSAHISKSKWIAQLVQEKVANAWPDSVSEMAGTWDDFPSLEDIRQGLHDDAKREQL
ncbi:MAG: CopG family transcriptional regulator [Pseudohongiella sp.]|nr:CopG family transcriptional regulator [Pseudohongiella sp.]MDO9520111.1 CopG family transcriptional regulator [Pseudohongiella sp.]MDP2126016.1 CopG family transcriptional regulator [Pseudohongiella sp.]